MEIGEIIRKRYQIECHLGQGGMGATYRAMDLNTDAPVAVKVLHLARLQDWKSQELFEREAKILKQLKHPRIPKYIDYFALDSAEDTQFVLVQEFIEGKSLQNLVGKEWRGTETEILAIVLQIAEILDYLHGLRPPVVHRDLTPKNILLSAENTVYLVDFGAVKEKMHLSLESGSTFVGTHGYMPIEQCQGQAEPASDYYALGGTLLYMLSHRHPGEFAFEHDRIQFRSVVQASPQILTLLDRLLEPKAKKRLASIQELRQLISYHPARLPKETITETTSLSQQQRISL